MAHNNGMIPQGGFAESAKGFGLMTGAEIAGFVPHRPARPEKSEGGKAFKLVSEYEPAGDQPTAIAELVGAINANERDQVLLGVTGSGKTFTMAKVIEIVQQPGADPGAQQNAGRAALRRDEALLPGKRGGVFRLLLRLLPAGSLYPAHRHLYRKGFLGERGDRPHAPFGDAGDFGARRRDHRGLGVVHLRHRRGGDLFRHRGDDRAKAPSSTAWS